MSSVTRALCIALEIKDLDHVSHQLRINSSLGSVAAGYKSVFEQMIEGSNSLTNGTGVVSLGLPRLKRRTALVYLGKGGVYGVVVHHSLAGWSAVERSILAVLIHDN